MNSSSLSSRMMKSKLSVRNPPLFKKSSKRNPNISLREVTIFKKALELATLCGIELCVLYYSRDGELIKTYPEDQPKVRDIAERFSQLSHGDKLKKSTTLAQFLNKKFNDELKRSLENNDGKVRQSLLELKDSLESIKQMFQDKTETCAVSPDLSPSLNTVDSQQLCTDQDLYSGLFTTDDLSPSLIDDPHQQWPDSLLNHLCTERDQSHGVYSGGFTTDLPPPLIDDPHQQWPDSLTNHLCTELGQSHGIYSGRLISDLPPPLIDDPHQQWTGFPTDFLSMTFDQQHGNDYGLLLGKQGLGSCNNVHLPPQMQTHLDQFGTWNYNQTPCHF